MWHSGPCLIVGLQVKHYLESYAATQQRSKVTTHAPLWLEPERHRHAVGSFPNDHLPVDAIAWAEGQRPPIRAVTGKNEAAI